MRGCRDGVGGDLSGSAGQDGAGGLCRGRGAARWWSAQALVEGAQHVVGDGDGVVVEGGLPAGGHKGVDLAVAEVPCGKVGFQAGAVFEFGDGVGEVGDVGKAGGFGQQGEASVGVGFGVDAHEVVDGQAAGFAVGDAEDAGERVGAGVCGGGAGPGEGESGGDGGFGHFFARVHVAGVFAGGFEVVHDEAGGVDGECVADGLVVDAPVGFDGVAEDVHAGAGGDGFGQGAGQFGVDDGADGVEGRGKQGGLDAFGVVGEDGDAADFAAGACGGGDGDEGQAACGDGEGAVEVGAGGVVAVAEGCCCLGAVQDAAAAEGDDEVAVVFVDEADAVVAFADVGVGGDLPVGGAQCAAAVGHEAVCQSVFAEEGGWKSRSRCPCTGRRPRGWAGFRRCRKAGGRSRRR